MRLLRQSLLAGIAGIGLALGLTFPANSLTADQAGKVAALLAELSAELGDFAYDEEEADRPCRKSHVIRVPPGASRRPAAAVRTLRYPENASTNVFIMYGLFDLIRPLRKSPTPG